MMGEISGLVLNLNKSLDDYFEYIYRIEDEEMMRALEHLGVEIGSYADDLKSILDKLKPLI